MTSKREEEPFKYDGRLLFNEVCLTSEVKSQKLQRTPRVAEAYLLDEVLKKFEEGNSQSPGGGYKRSLIRDYSEKLPEYIREFVDSMIALQYKEESYATEEAEVRVGERKPVKIPSTKSVDIFWASPNYMMIRGAEGAAESARGDIQSYLSGDASVKTVRFDHQFLLWLFYKHFNDESFNDNLSSDRLVNAESKGAEDILGKTSVVEEAPDVKDAPNFLLCLIHGKSVSMLEGDFVIQTGPEDEETVRVEIQPDKIQIKASKAGLKNSNRIEKMGLAAKVTCEILEIYDKWDRQDAENSDKIVPPDFIAELLKRCHNHGVDITNHSTVLRVLKQQARRRGEQLEDYDLSEALEFLSGEETTSEGDINMEESVSD